MLKKYLPGKTRHLDFVFLEPGRAEYLQCHWKRGSWEFNKVSHISAANQESIFKALQLFCFDMQDKRNTGLVVILAKPFYSFSKRFYPAHLGSELKKAIEFDWEENLPATLNGQMRRHGSPFRLEEMWLVPFQSLQEETHDAVASALSAKDYSFFLTVPSHAAFGHYFKNYFDSGAQERQPEFVIAPLSGDSAEIYRLSGLQVVDLVELKPGGCANNVLLATMASLADFEDCGEHSVLLLDPVQGVQSSAAHVLKGIKHETRPMDEPLVMALARSLLHTGSVAGFNGYKRLLPAGMRLYSLLMGLAIALLLSATAGALYLEQQMSIKLETNQAVLEAKKQEYFSKTQNSSKDEASQRKIELLQSAVQQGLPPTRTLNVLSEITPKHTWIRRLDYDQGKLTLTCIGDDALEYRDILSKTPGFAEVEFTSSVKRDGGKENYTLAMRLQPEVLPETSPEKGAEQAKDSSSHTPPGDQLEVQGLPEELAGDEPGPDPDELFNEAPGPDPDELFNDAPGPGPSPEIQ